MTDPGLPYKVTRDKRFNQVVTQDTDRHAYNKDYFKDFGIISPDEDPGLVLYDREYFTALCRQHAVRFQTNEGSNLSDPKIAQLNADCKSDKEGFENKSYLPKGVMKLNDYDKTRENLVINYTEDNPEALSKTLAALNKLFTLNESDVITIREKYNIFVTWSTSIEDTLKTFKVIGEKIGDWTKANVLFLNDLNINEGTGPNFTPMLTHYGYNMGKLITGLVTKVFGLLPNRTRTIIQTADRDEQSIFWSPQILDPSTWSQGRGLHYLSLVSSFSQIFHIPTITIGKISGAVQDDKFAPRNLLGLIKGFVGYMEGQAALSLNPPK